MGNWTLIIEGIGPHHNNDKYGVDVLSQEFVSALKDSGHRVDRAILAHGGKDDLLTKHSFHLDGKLIESSKAYLTGIEIKKLANCSILAHLYRKIGGDFVDLTIEDRELVYIPGGVYYSVMPIITTC